MDLVGEGDAFEKLLNGSRGAGDGAKDGPGRGWAGRRHDSRAEYSVAERTGCRSYTGNGTFGGKEKEGLVYDDVCCAIVQPAPLLDLFVPLATTSWCPDIWLDLGGVRASSLAVI